MTAWERFKSLYWANKELGMGLDISRMNFPESFFMERGKMIADAVSAMKDLEAGGIANPDEKRMVGHYWLRAADMAPNAELKSAIINTLNDLKTFAADIRSGKIKGQGGTFQDVLHIGIGGSALGPQFIHDALGKTDKVRLHFVDNTDPDGIAKIIADIPDLTRTLVVVVSKSGGTKETRNGQFLAKKALTEAGVDYKKAFVAVTGVGSALDKTATDEGWLARFPMWDWVGGRTSLWSAVGVLPAALEGVDVDALLEGAAAMDKVTRNENPQDNPALLMALMWFIAAAEGKAMVVLPYKDRLMFLSRYLQQLIMESLGKERDVDGKVVNQGLVVYGNKGSTDQHAYVQQLREGPNNFFTLFINSGEDICEGGDKSYGEYEVEEGVTSGDFLLGFLYGTRKALYDNGRQSIAMSVPTVNARSVGAMLALFERAVGFYATFANINAYHQPGVEAGKKAAGEILKLQAKIVSALATDKKQTVEEIAQKIGSDGEEDVIFAILEHLAANGRAKAEFAENVAERRYSI